MRAAALPWPRLGPGLMAAVAAAMLFALCIGRYPLPLADILRFLGAALGLVELPAREYDTLFNLIVRIRLPRVLAAVLVGSALASAGAAFQGVFRNPLVSPGLLGVLAGSAFGAALGILLDLPWRWSRRWPSPWASPRSASVSASRRCSATAASS